MTAHQQIPDVAIQWLVRNDVHSNVQLAVLSNVSRQWRRVVMSVVLRVILNEDDNKESSSPSSPFLSSLLLPSMARALLQQQQQRRSGGESSGNKKLFLSSTDTDEDDDTFCLAWFPPTGIQIMSVPLGEQPMSSEDEMMERESLTDAFVAASRGGASYYEGSEVNLPNSWKNCCSPSNVSPTKRVSSCRQPKSRAVFVTDDPRRRQTCSHEWRGYRYPMQVLKPFGYATRFVHGVLNSTMESSAEGTKGRMAGESTSMPRNSDHQGGGEPPALSREYRTTCAVRGATFARPDGYCLCWDTQIEAIVDDYYDIEVLGGDNSAIQNSGKQWEQVRHLEYKRLIRSRRRRELHQLTLPRIILSTKDKQKPDSDDACVVGKRQRSLQFLNAEGSHAVRLMTLPFDTGPIHGPVTVFLVGIATEDGCFISGLKCRYEMGHMYPTDPRDALIDMSPICIVTDCPRRDKSQTAAGQVSTSCSPSARLQGFSANDSIDSNGDSSCESELRHRLSERDSLKCDCPFEDSRMCKPLSDCVESDDDDCEHGPHEDTIYRGQLGPGLWHCYVAIFDGDDSVIRIDGSSEPIRRFDPHDNMSSNRVAATLDGLTIGSDHRFDMSLCYGNGASGEGEGAISELAVFKGRLGISDIERMEQYLMNKHGISAATSKDSSATSLAQEDEWRRQAHALIAQSPPWKLTGEALPLRVIAKHRSVAWHLTNGVTGKVLPVPRIGSKYSTGSSDW